MGTTLSGYMFQVKKEDIQNIDWKEIEKKVYRISTFFRWIHDNMQSIFHIRADDGIKIEDVPMFLQLVRKEGSKIWDKEFCEQTITSSFLSVSNWVSDIQDTLELIKIYIEA